MIIDRSSEEPIAQSRGRATGTGSDEAPSDDGNLGPASPHRPGRPSGTDGVEMTLETDWLAWHEPYADPESPLSRRLRLSQGGHTLGGLRPNRLIGPRPPSAHRRDASRSLQCTTAFRAMSLNSRRPL